MFDVVKHNLITTLAVLGLFGGLASAQTFENAPLPPAPEVTGLPEPIFPVAPPPPPDLSPAPAWPLKPLNELDPRSIIPASAIEGIPGEPSATIPMQASVPYYANPVPAQRWYVLGESMFLKLSHSSTQPLAYDIIDVAPGGPGALVQVGPVVTTNTISNSQMLAVPRVTVGYRYTERTSIEGTYFGRNDWSGATSLSASPLGNPSIVAFETPDTLLADKLSTSLATELHSAELNVAEKLDNYQSLELLAGFRYLGFFERFQFHSQKLAGGDLFQTQYNLQTSNNLYGLQLGLRWSRSWGGLSIVGTGKTGLYANGAMQDQLLVYSRNTFGFPAHNLTMARPGFALIQDLGLNGQYRISDSWSIRAGYNLFVISGLARAGEEIDFSLNPVPALDRHGTAVLHGPSAGIELRF